MATTTAVDRVLGTLQRLQGQLPAHLARRDLAELAVLLRYADQGTWAFAVYNTVAVREEVADTLRTLMSPLPTYDVRLSAQNPDPLAAVRQAVPGETTGAIVFIHDIGTTDGLAWHYLEMNREALATYSHRLVFWITTQDRRDGILLAPNFWSMRGGVFDFTIETPALVTEIRASWAGQPVRLDSPDDWNRQMRLFSGLLAEYAAADAPPVALADLHGKLGYLYSFAGQYNEAYRHLEQQLALARVAGDREQQVAALNNLGSVALITHGEQEARSWYESAMEIAGDVPSARAMSLLNLALSDTRRGESKIAFARLHEALTIYRAIGHQLGQANCIKSLGDVHLALADYPAARARYDEALTIYRAIGDQLGQANCIRSLGDYYVGTGNYPAALAAFEDAATRYRALGLRNDEAGALSGMADVYARQRDYAKAIEYCGRALQASDTAIWYRHRAAYYMDSGNLENAAQDLAAAERRQPGHPYLFLRRGQLELLRQQPQAAETLFRSALEQIPHLNEAHFGLGQALLLQGRAEEALNSLRTGLEHTHVASDLDDVIERLAALEARGPALPGLAEAVALLRDARIRLRQR